MRRYLAVITVFLCALAITGFVAATLDERALQQEHQREQADGPP